MDRETLTVDVLLKAYELGVFPMSESRDDTDVFWVDPRKRGIIPIGGFHFSRSLARRIRKGGFRVSVNEDFAGVMQACADRPETWISETIFDIYAQLHALGHAHSMEIRDESGLIGGVYGVTLGAAFFGESMFSRRTDGSKIALAYLMDRLQQAGFLLFDTQFITPHLQRLGGIEIPRSTFHDYLEEAIATKADFTTPPLPASPQALLQRNTQTS
ncbi:leucyl/phenylalanyl-tRNA--protein transferase [Pseudoruegeria sp. SK021]|uniref:leucyl/phenylalanyl-tRNA--protein transferase n=1 Tax=Pseudoruegeria sp. SK021 TaxID=1933035 RepID=UPI000A222F8C|nr:leucyl/phenylalanyl-tRNA--protein transferase [Pseudoruegeria sp. SK021]OSP54959.1 leucyl/phenylalanyl-tRNA--protein transferase [Pseudoruegeria sp. SK021]